MYRKRFRSPTLLRSPRSFAFLAVNLPQRAQS